MSAWVTATWFSDEVFRLGAAKSGVSSAYSKAGSMLDDCQSMKSVTTVGSSLETKIFFCLSQHGKAWEQLLFECGSRQRIF